MYLVNFMESKPWLAKGHARTAHARIRTREAWMDISTALNSDGGCVKTPDQWCKYWKDKKGAVKRKSSLISAKRRQTGGGQVDIPELTEMETKILCIMGGESFGSGDRQYEVDPFQEEVTNRVTEGTDESPSILQNVTLPDATNSQPLEEYLVHWNQSALAVMGEGSVQASLASPTPNVVVTPQATVYAENTGLGTGEPQMTAQQAEILSPGSTETPTQRIRRETLRSRRRLLQQSPRGSAMRRRLLRRSPPTQRRSEMVTLTERFIAIEERRAEAELMMAQAIRASSEGCQVIARAIDRVCDIFSTYLNN